MQQTLARVVPPTQRQMFLSYNDMVDWGLWYEFCNIRGFNLFAVHEGKIKQHRRFRLSQEEIRRLGLSGQCPRNLQQGNNR